MPLRCNAADASERSDDERRRPACGRVAAHAARGLRVAVEANAGVRGFSHAAALGAEGPVLLLGADDLVVWSAPAELRRLTYDAVDVVKRPVGKWRIVVPAPPSPDTDSVPGAPRRRRRTPLTIDVTKDIGTRVRDRALIDRNPAAQRLVGRAARRGHRR